MMASSLALRLMVKCPNTRMNDQRPIPTASHRVQPPARRRSLQNQYVCAAGSRQKGGLAAIELPVDGPFPAEQETCRPAPGANSRCAGSALSVGAYLQARASAADSQSFARP